MRKPVNQFFEIADHDTLLLDPDSGNGRVVAQNAPAYMKQ
jgi:hypothetical protein